MVLLGEGHRGPPENIIASTKMLYTVTMATYSHPNLSGIKTAYRFLFKSAAFYNRVETWGKLLAAGGGGGGLQVARRKTKPATIFISPRVGPRTQDN